MKTLNRLIAFMFFAIALYEGTLRNEYSKAAFNMAIACFVAICTFSHDEEGDGARP